MGALMLLGGVGLVALLVFLRALCSVAHDADQHADQAFLAAPDRAKEKNGHA